MINPWLHIPLEDYEAHMSLPQVDQGRLLADVFVAALLKHQPRSVAVLGCSGGNGFDCIDPDITRRVVGIDLNPEYIEQARVRFQHRLHDLKLFAGDVQTDVFSFAPVDMAYAALLFEYVDVPLALRRILAMLVPAGLLITLVQLPNPRIAEVTPSPHAALATLSSIMHLVPPDELSHAAATLGYREADARTVATSAGKHFRVQEFRAMSPG